MGKSCIFEHVLPMRQLESDKRIPARPADSHHPITQNLPKLSLFSLDHWKVAKLKGNHVKYEFGNIHALGTDSIHTTCVFLRSLERASLGLQHTLWSDLGSFETLIFTGGVAYRFSTVRNQNFIYTLFHILVWFHFSLVILVSHQLMSLLTQNRCNMAWGF